MMLIRRISNVLIFHKNHGSIGHIKDMVEQNLKTKTIEVFGDAQYVQNSRIYKPTYTIEFNRQGEVLIYSANPVKNATIYFKYPYILYQSFIPLALLNYGLNPFDLSWYWQSFGLYGCTALTIPRIWYFAEFKWRPRRIYLMRGGRCIRVQVQTLGAERYTYWIQNQFIRPLTEDKMRFDDRDEADFLTKEGQLKYDLDIEIQEFRFFGVSVNNQQLFLDGKSTVHHPEIFEAAIKGYNIDTTDFCINTADNARFKEGNYDV